LILFFPPPVCEAAMLEEGIGDHRHERVTVKTLPGSSLKVIEAEFFFQLLMGLLADPPRLDGRSLVQLSGRKRRKATITGS
jgi:hypothetical protein